MAQEDQTVLQSEEEKKRQRQKQTVAPQLEDYELLRSLGEGAFGQVWGAIQKRTGQKVAVKFLHESGGQSWSYFRHELERLREVSEHPGVVTLIDADLSATPAYFVMPWLGRGSLANLEQRAALSQVLDWFAQMASALQFTHEKGILHCDLKPSNVLLDQEGRVRLVDFGQARLHGEGGAYGTFGYMPPEQAAGQAPDIRWDLYALGATVYYLLAGRTPRVSGHDLSQLATLSGTSERLSKYRELLLTRPLEPLPVDGELNHLLASCLQLEPAARPASAAEVLQDLERRRQREPLLCRRPWSFAYRLDRFCRRPINQVAVGLSLLLMLVLGFSLAEMQRKNSDLRLQICEMRQERGVAMAVSDPQQALLWWQSALHSLPGGHPTVERNLRLLMRYHLLHSLEWRVSQSQRGLAIFLPGTNLLLAALPGERPQLLDVATGKATAELQLAMAEQLEDGNLAVSPSSGWLAVFSRENRVALYQGTRLIQEFPVPSGVLDMRVDERGKLEVLSRAGRHLHLPEPDGQRLDLHQGGLTPAGGHWLVDAGHRLRVYDSRGTELGNWPCSVDCSGAGRHLAYGLGKTAGQIDLTTGRPAGASLAHPAEVTSVSLSPDGSLLATTCQDHNLRIWQMPEGLIRASRPYTTDCTALRFSPDGKSLIQSCADGKSRLWDCRSGNLYELWRDPQSACAIVFSPQQDRILLQASLGGLSLRKVIPPPCQEMRPPGSPQALAYLPDGRLLVGHAQGLGAWDGQQLAPLSAGSVDRLAVGGSWVWLHAEAGDRLLSLSGQPVFHSANPWRSVSFRDQTALAASQSDKFLEFLTLSPPTPTAVPGARMPAMDCAVLAHSSLAALSNPQGEALLQLWKDPKDAHPLEVGPLGHEPGVLLTADPDSGRLVVGGQQGGLALLDRNLKKLADYRFTQVVLAIQYSPDRRLLAVASQDGTARVFDSSDLSLKFNELAHAQRSPITCLAFSPDGGWLATGCSDGTARVWDSLSGQLLTGWLGHDGPVTALAFAPDGNRLATASQDGKVRLWDLTGSGVPGQLSAATGMVLNADNGSIKLVNGGP
ncbi:MAG: WD40 repeat domain-containing serine/threonine-protein kinase [Vulcanimicrobiota bacterium]